MAIIFSKLVGKNEPLYGKFEHPIKALIQNESNALEKKKTLLDVLFNVEKSNRYAETTMGQTDFDTFQSVKEGAGAENDSIELAFKKTIEHIPFMKEFTITKEMADDSKMGLGANVKAKPKGFVRAYYKTRTKLAAWALAHATETGGKFNKAYVDLTTGDGNSEVVKAVNTLINGYNETLDKLHAMETKAEQQEHISAVLETSTKAILEILATVYANNKNIPQAVKDLVNIKYVQALKAELPAPVETEDKGDTEEA